MKTFIVTVATIILGVVMFLMIVGADSNSLKKKTEGIFNSAISELNDVKP